MSQTDTTVAEIVTFRLIPGADAATFVAHARALEPKLRATGQVLARTLSADENGTWTDHIIWTSLQAAKAAAEQIIVDPDAAPMMQMIDPNGVKMRHAQIHYQQE